MLIAACLDQAANVRGSRETEQPHSVLLSNTLSFSQLSSSSFERNLLYVASLSPLTSMNFGYRELWLLAFGDFVTAIQLTHDIRRQLVNAPATFGGTIQPVRDP